MKYGAVYERRGKLIVHPDGKTSAGVLIGIEPYIVLEKDATSAAEIGASLRSVLAKSRDNLRHPGAERMGRRRRAAVCCSSSEIMGCVCEGLSLNER
jgi:hypothetical protein